MHPQVLPPPFYGGPPVRMQRMPPMPMRGFRPPLPYRMAPMPMRGFRPPMPHEMYPMPNFHRGMRPQQFRPRHHHQKQKKPEIQKK